MNGNIISLLALYGCIPMVLYLFSKYKPERAVILAFFGALMFLPMAKLNVPLIIYDKMTATAIGVLIAIKMYDPQKLEGASIHPVDIPMVIWIISGFLSSVANGLGVKDGLQESFNTFTIWGIPYIAGRLYFTNADSIKLLCRSVFAAGLIYIPFVLFELKMSPQAHRIVYGYMQHSFAQVMRGDGYRPMVFMQHGIMLGTWMCMAALVGLWCTYTKVFPKKMWHAPTILLVLVLLGAAIACKSSGAAALLIIGLAALFLTSKLKVAILVWIMLIIPPAYIGTRATGYWDGQNLCDLITEKFSADRASSLQFRFDNENILVDKALKKPLFGWGGWGRSRVYDDETGEDVSITDGFWIITLGTRGYLGLFSITLAMILPAFLFLLKCPAGKWGKPEFAPTAVLCIVPLLFMIDSLLNAMVNQAYVIFAGGTSGMLARYGITRLEKQAATHHEEGSPDPGTRQHSARPKSILEALRLRKKRNGGTAVESGMRHLVDTDFSEGMTAYAMKPGLVGFQNSDGPRFLRGGKKAEISLLPRKEEKMSPETAESFCRGPRNLMDPEKIKPEHMAHQFKVHGTAETSGDYPVGESLNEIDSHTGKKWVKRS